MSEFKNVTVHKSANIYFEGKVTSRLISFPDGSTKTLGIMLPGDYEFNTDLKEIMEVLSGRVDILLPDSSEWLHFDGSGSFTVPAHASFKLKVHSPFDYCCSYVRN